MTPERAVDVGGDQQDLTAGASPLRVNGRWKGRHSGQDGDHNM